GAGDELGGEPGAFGAGIAVEHPGAAGALDPAQGGGLAAEAAPELDVDRPGRADEVDGDAPPGRGDGRTDHPHASRAEAADDAVGADPLWIARQQRLQRALRG